MPAPAVHALLYISRTPPRVLGAPQEALPVSEGEFEDYRQTQAALLKSRLVLNAALRQPKVAALAVVREHADPVGWLESALHVDFQLAPEILRVGLNGRHPEELVTVVNTVTHAYLEEVVAKEQNQRLERLDQLKSLQARYEDRLKQKRQMVREVAEAAGEGALSSFERDLLLQDLLDCKRELRRARLARVAAEARPNKEAPGPRADIAALAAQEKFLTEEEQQLRTKAAAAGRSSLDLQLLRDEIAQVEGVARRITAEAEALDVERGAPPRVRLL
jgi:hypothetical protein